MSGSNGRVFAPVERCETTKAKPTFFVWHFPRKLIAVMNLVPIPEASNYLRARAGIGGNNGTIPTEKLRRSISPPYRKSDLQVFQHTSYKNELREKRRWDSTTQVTSTLPLNSPSSEVLEERHRKRQPSPMYAYGDAQVARQQSGATTVDASGSKATVACENDEAEDHPNTTAESLYNYGSDPREEQILVLQEALARERRNTRHALQNAYEREQRLLDELSKTRAPAPVTQVINGEDVEAIIREVKEQEVKRRQEAENKIELLEKENEALRDSLILAKSYTLHKAMENMMLDSKKSDEKLKRIIVHLQADKNNLLDKLSSLQ